MARFNKIRFCLLAVASSISCSILLADDEPSSPTSETKTLKGKVVKVIDGDSIVLKTDSNEETIHLDGIDAPEFKQSGGDKSSSFLKKLINEKDVEVRWEKKDNFQRILGTVYLGETNINLEMVAKGWHGISSVTTRAINWPKRRRQRKKPSSAYGKKLNRCPMGLSQEQSS